MAVSPGANPSASASSNDETSPLLPRRSRSASPSPSPSQTRKTDHHQHHHGRHRRSSAFICMLLLIIAVCLEFADTVPRAALTRIYEAVYCRQYYRDHRLPGDGREGGSTTVYGAGFGDDHLAMAIPEEYCKVPQVQGEVALLKAWSVAFDAGGSLPLAIPWGYFADSHGRKPMLVILLTTYFAKSVWVQIVCYCWRTIPIRWVWLGSLQSVLGGGAVSGAVLYTSIADVTDQDERVSIFFRFGAAQLFSGFIASPLSAWLMQFGPFTPTVLGSAIFLVAFLALCFLPETMNYKSEGSPPTAPDAEPARSESHGGSERQTGSIKTRVKSLLRSVQDAAGFLTSDARILLFLPIYSIHYLLYNTDDLLLQYASERFHMSISRATLVISLQAGLKVVALLLLLPALTNHLTKRFNYHGQRKDLLLARGSAAAMALGFLCIGLAPSLPWLIMALPVQVAGWGLMFLMRSLLTSLVEQHHVARLYIVLVLIDAAGLTVGTPAMAALFDWGVSVGSWGGGLPFVVCGFALMAVEVVLLSVRMGEEKGGGDVEDDRSSLLS